MFYFLISDLDVYMTARGALRVIPRGRHGWRFTARIKCKYLANEIPNVFSEAFGNEPDLAKVGGRHGDHALADRKMVGFFEKLSSPGSKSNLGGPAGSSAP